MDERVEQLERQLRATAGTVAALRAKVAALEGTAAQLAALRRLLAPLLKSLTPSVTDDPFGWRAWQQAVAIIGGDSPLPTGSS